MDLLLRIRALLLRRRVEAELDEELASHLDLQTRKYIAQGFGADEARRRAQIDFGARESAREDCRDARGINWLSHLAQDLRYAIRMFRRSPGLTCFVVLILALGMGATLATFSVTDALLLRMLPVHDPQSLFRTVRAGGNSNDADSGVSYPLFLQMRKRTVASADLMAYRAGNLASIRIGQWEPRRFMQQTVSGNYFAVLAVKPALGRLISEEDDRERTGNPIAVIGYRLWKAQLDGDPTVLGRTLSFGNRVYVIVGVAPAEFFGVEVGKIVDIWTPVSMAPAADLDNDHAFWLRLVGRVKPGATIAQATAPMQAVLSEFMLQDVRLHAPPGTPQEVIARFLAGTRIKGVPAGGGVSSLKRQYEQPLQILMLVVGLVMLIACSSVAGILIARGSIRSREFAIRLSLGAGTGRIVRQLLTESTLIAALAAVAGLVVGHQAAPVLVGLLTPTREPASLITAIDLRLLAFTTLLTLMTVVVCGLIPAVRLTKADLHTAVKDGLRVTGGTVAGKCILIAQVALSMVLVVEAGFFARTLMNFTSTRLGFDPSGVLVARLTLQGGGNEGLPIQPWQNLLRSVSAFPGIDHASLSSAALFGGDPQFQGIRTTAAIQPADPLTAVSFVSAGYFSTLRIGFAAGRDFQDFDEQSQAPAVAIVSQAFARKFFGDENPIGQKLTKLANEPVWTEIIGVVNDVKVNKLREAAPPMIYVPYGRATDWLPRQAHPGLSMYLLVSGAHDIAALPSELRRSISSALVVDSVFRQEQLIGDTLVRERLMANIAAVFGVLALVLAAAGLYGMMSYLVVRRWYEIGIRIAMGAAPGAIMALVFRDSAAVLLPGTILGLVASRAVSNQARSLLYGLAPDDAGTYVVALAVLLSGLLIATAIPALRATHVDPMKALRSD